MRLIFVSSLRIVGEKQVRRPGDVRDPFVHGAILQPVHLVSDNRERNYSPDLDCNYLSVSSGTSQENIKSLYFAQQIIKC